MIKVCDKKMFKKVVKQNAIFIQWTSSFVKESLYNLI